MPATSDMKEARHVRILNLGWALLAVLGLLACGSKESASTSHPSALSHSVTDSLSLELSAADMAAISSEAEYIVRQNGCGFLALNIFGEVATDTGPRRLVTMSSAFPEFGLPPAMSADWVSCLSNAVVELPSGESTMTVKVQPLAGLLWGQVDSEADIDITGL